MTAQNLESVRKFYNAFTTGDTSDFDTILAANWQPMPPVPGNPGGRAGQKGTVGFLHSVLADIAYSVDDIYAFGDSVVACRCMLRGTQRGPFLGLAPTGQKIALMTMEFHHFANGQITHTWHLEDFFGVYQGLMASGATPAS